MKILTFSSPAKQRPFKDTPPWNLLHARAYYFSTCISSPDVRQKLQKLEDGPQTPQKDLLSAAFKVFNNRVEETKLEKQTWPVLLSS